MKRHSRRPEVCLKDKLFVELKDFDWFTLGSESNNSLYIKTCGNEALCLWPLRRLFKVHHADTYITFTSRVVRVHEPRGRPLVDWPRDGSASSTRMERK